MGFAPPVLRICSEAPLFPRRCEEQSDDLSAVARRAKAEAIHLSVMPRHRLLRFARNDGEWCGGAAKCPDGQISKNLSSPRSKNIPPSAVGQIISTTSPIPTRQEVRIATLHGPR